MAENAVYKELVVSLKQKLQDITPEEEPASRLDICQLKYDGWWVLLKGHEDEIEIISSGGVIKNVILLEHPVPDFLFIAEWIYGTNWAKSSELEGQFVIHDLIYCENMPKERAMKTPYAIRVLSLTAFIEHYLDYEELNFEIIQSFPASKWKKVWKEFVIDANFEGLIFKRTLGFFGDPMERKKRIFTMDYVVTGFNEGKGRLEGTLGSLVGSLFADGVLVKTCTIGGGFSDELRDKIWKDKMDYYLEVVEVSGKGLFDSGALRHPAFVRFREDKEALDCRKN